jgi:hypothetical protein
MIRLTQPGQNGDEGCFASAVGTEKAKELTFVDIKGNVIQSLQDAILL